MVVVVVRGINIFQVFVFEISVEIVFSMLLSNSSSRTVKNKKLDRHTHRHENYEYFCFIVNYNTIFLQQGYY